MREWDAVARLMGLPGTQCWPDVAGLRRYVEDEVRCAARGSSLVPEKLNSLEVKPRPSLTPSGQNRRCSVIRH